MRPLVAAAALALLAACDSLLSAELEVPQVRVTLPPQSIPASDTDNRAFFCDPFLESDPPCIGVSVSYDIGADLPILNEPGVAYDLRLTDLTLRAVAGQGVTDLSGVARATLLVLGEAGTAGTVIARYERGFPAGAQPVPSLAVRGDAGLDLGPFLRAGVLPIRVELVIDSPLPAFEADIEADFSLEVDVDYVEYL